MLTNFLWAMQRQPGLTAQDSLLAVTTLSFDIAALELFLPLVVGARIMIASREIATDGTRLAETLQNTHVTAMQATPATWHLLLDAGWTSQARLSKFSVAESRFRAISPETAREKH